MIVMNREQVLTNLIQWMRNAGSGITNYNIGGTTRGMLGAFASLLAQLYYDAWSLLRGSLVIYAEGGALDDVVAGRGIKRQSATSSSCAIRYTGTNTTVIPTGHKTATESGIEFVTVESRNIGDDGSGIVDIEVEATVPGVSGRVKQNTINTIVDSIDGLVSIDNLVSAEGGYDYEADETLRSRTITQISTLSLGISDSYQAWAREANIGVLRAKPQYGNPQYPDKTVLVHLVKNNAGVFTVNDLEGIENYIQSKAPLGTIVRCINIAWTTMDIFAQVKPRAGFTTATIRDNIIKNAQLYLDFREREWGDEVQWADIFSLCNNTTGVDDISQASFQPGSNLAIGPYSLPLLGSVALSDF